MVIGQFESNSGYLVKGAKTWLVVKSYVVFKEFSGTSAQKGRVHIGTHYHAGFWYVFMRMLAIDGQRCLLVCSLTCKINSLKNS